MKSPAFVLAALFVAAPAYAQLGAISGIKKGIDTANKISDLHMSDKEERLLGEQVSARLREDFGVLQDEQVTKYVTLVGSVLGQLSTKPALDWQFIVLDTDGVNAFAAPGGIVHITKGALGLIKNEAELAGILGHEITHITKQHTISAIKNKKLVSLGTDEVGGAGGLTAAVLSRLAEAAYSNIINNQFDRGDELESDKIGVGLASRAGYKPDALNDVLVRIAERNSDQKEPNGMFASHPLIKDRVEDINSVIKKDKLNGTATVAARYTSVITFDVKPLSAIPVIEGVRGLTGGSGDSKDKEASKEEKKPKKSLLGKFSTSSSEQKASNQTIASAGARGIRPDRDATGGPNKGKLSITVTPVEIEIFKKGIVA